MLQIYENDFLSLIHAQLGGQNLIKIQDIKSRKAKNLLRGIEPNNLSHTRAALTKIRKTCKYSDYKLSVAYVRSNAKFENNHYGQFLNKFCPKRSTELVIFSESEIRSQINNYSKELKAISEVVYSLLLYLKNNELENAIKKCNELIDEKGVSVFLIKTISFISNRYQLLEIEDKVILSNLEILKKKMKISNAEFIVQAVNQLSNLRISHLSVCKRINELSDDFSNSLIVKSFIHPIPRDNEEYIKTLNSYFSFSLFDAFLYIKMIEGFNLPFINSKKLNLELNNLYENISNIEFLPEKIYKEVDENSAYYYLRECFLFIEQPKAVKFLSVHSHYYSDFKSARPLPEIVKKMVNDYFSGVKSLGDLRCTKMTSCEINWNKYSSNSCGMLENSSALVHILSMKEGYLSSSEQEQFVKLMSFTRDIGEICRPEYLETLSSSSSENILKLVTQCLFNK